MGSRANIFTGQWERKNHIGFTMVSHNLITEEAFANSWLMKLKDAGYCTAFIGKHHTKMVDRGNTPLKENTDFCYYGEGHLGFHFGKHKAFTNLKNRSQVEGLFEATEAFLRPGRDFDYFYKNADIPGDTKKIGDVLDRHTSSELQSVFRPGFGVASLLGASQDHVVAPTRRAADRLLIWLNVEPSDALDELHSGMLVATDAKRLIQ